MQNRTKLWYIIIAVVSFAVFIVTSVVEYGYHHADELYQIIEFAGIKTDSFTPYVAWEYEAQIRPMLQPSTCLALLKMFGVMSITDPFVQALLMRLFTVMLSFFAIILFARNTIEQFSTQKRRVAYFAVSLLLWFVPYVACRFMSETYGGIFLLLALAIYFSYKDKAIPKVLLGVCLALSFVFRFQMALSIFGFLLWTIFIDMKAWRFYVLPIVSFVATYLVLGIGVDSWYYGEFVFAPYNYLFTNIDVSADMFGSEPWWFYLYNIVSAPSLVIGIPLALSVVYLLVRKPQNPYLWCVIPFVLVHSVISHKEARFLFPMVFLAPALLMSVVETIETRLSKSRLKKIICWCVAVPMFIANCAGLAVVTTMSAGQQKLYLAKYINSNHKDEKVNIIYGWYSNPYGPFGGISGFYRNENAIMQRYDNIYDVKVLLDKDATNFLSCRKHDIRNMVCVGEFANSDPFEVLEKLGFKYESQSVPGFTEWIWEHCIGYDTDDILYVFKYVGRGFVSESKDYQGAKIFYTDCEEDAQWNQKQTLSDSEAYSGKFSSLVYNGSPYSLTLEKSAEEVASFKNMSVFMRIYQSDTLANACISFEMLRSEAEKNTITSHIDDNTECEWRNITANFDLPEDFRDYAGFKVYLYNPTETKIYCDDIVVVFN